MDAQQFDRLVRSLSASGSRRGVVRLLTALPLASVLVAFLEAESDAAGRRKRRKKRHKHQQGDGKENRKGEKKGKDKCRPESIAQTCAGKCAIVTNRCGVQVDCGPCTCATGCPQCQSCNTATGLCMAVVDGASCDDGTACTPTDTCQSGVCVGSNPVVCDPPNACQTGSGTYDPATGACSYPNGPNGTTCGTQSETGGGTTHCCDGECPDPECLPAGQPCLDIADCSARCCTKGAVLLGGNFTCSPSGDNFDIPCGSDVDCNFPSGVCQCGICCSPPGTAPSSNPSVGCGRCCSGACNDLVCA